MDEAPSSEPICALTKPGGAGTRLPASTAESSAVDESPRAEVDEDEDEDEARACERALPARDDDDDDDEDGACAVDAAIAAAAAMVADMPNGRAVSEDEVADEEEEEAEADVDDAAAAVTRAAAATRSGSAICQRPPRLGDDKTTLLKLPLLLLPLWCAGAAAAAEVPTCEWVREPSPLAVTELAVAPAIPVLAAAEGAGAAAILADSMASVSLLLACGVCVETSNLIDCKCERINLTWMQAVNSISI